CDRELVGADRQGAHRHIVATESQIYVVRIVGESRSQEGEIGTGAAKSAAHPSDCRDDGVLRARGVRAAAAEYIAGNAVQAHGVGSTDHVERTVVSSYIRLDL